MGQVRHAKRHGWSGFSRDGGLTRFLGWASGACLRFAWCAIRLDKRESIGRVGVRFASACECPIHCVKQRRDEWGIRYSEGLVGIVDRCNVPLVDRRGECSVLLRVASVQDRIAIFVFLIEDSREVIVAASVVEDEL
jgi:hypothetical protein